jgi:hypothetical protein
MSGMVVPKRKEDSGVTFKLEFVGINSKNEGLFSLANSSNANNSKRKYNLVVNDSAPSFDDHRRYLHYFLFKLRM